MVVVCLDGTNDGSQEQNKDDISTPAMILPDSLGIIHAAIQGWGSPHGETNTILEEKNDRSDDTEISMDRVKVRTVVCNLVILDDGHASNKDQEGHEVETGMYALADALLLCRMSRLQT